MSSPRPIITSVESHREPDAQVGTEVQIPQRRCGRCQGAFDGDSALFFQTDWALCPRCQEILLKL